MIITLKGANFASSNIGTLDSWLISKSLTGATIDNTVTSVKKGEAYKAVITLKENYTFPDTITVTMGGTDITSTYVTKTSTTITIDIPSVTGNIVIRVNATSVGTSTDQYNVTYNLKGVRSGNTTTAVNKESTYISKIAVLTNSALTSTPAVSYTITMGGTKLTLDTDYTISNLGDYEKLLTIGKVTGDLVINIEAVYSTTSSTALDAGKWPSPTQFIGSAIQYYPTITSDSSTLMYMTVPSNVHVYTYMNNVMITGTSEYSSIVLRPSASDTVIEYYAFNESSRGHHFKSYDYETQLYYHSSVLTTSYMYPADTSTLVSYTITAYPSTATINVNTSDSSIPLARANGTLTFTAPAGTSITYTVSLSGYTSQSETITLTQSGTSSKVVTLVKEETTTWLALPTTKYGLGVTSTGTGRVSSNNAKRFSTADATTANGILIPSGKTLHLRGLDSGTYPLRVDYIYCTDNVKCPVSNSTTAIEGLVGTCSNYVSSNYFPLNKEGNDTLNITNNHGGDYYFWFGFAGTTLNEEILAEYDTYTLEYYVD